MSADFWWGMFCIPAAAVAVAGVLAAVLIVAVPLVWYSERFSLGDWKLWPRRTADYNRNVLPAIVACAKWTRYLWVPGWHIVICRTTVLRNHLNEGAERERQRKVQWAVRDALREVNE